eukprot:c24182_g1_i1 orf=98-2221(+)
MSLVNKGGRRSCRFLLQLRQHSSPSSPPRPLSAHLGLQKFRLQSTPFALHGSFSLLSRPCLHHFSFSPSFSTAAEADHSANSADTEAISSIDSAEMEIQRSYEAPAAAMASKLDGEQEESVLRKMLEEHRMLVSSLRAELEDQRTLTRSILDEVRILKLQADAKTAEVKLSTEKRPWPEWIAFMEHLQSSEFFKDEKRAPSPNSSSVFEDPACVKRAIYKFSQSHDSVFESLSRIDLRILARYGCAANDPKAAASQMRLCQFFHIEDTSSNAGAAKPSSTQPKLSDVTRLLHSTILEGTFGDEVRSSISYLLREIITLCRKPSVGPPLPADTTTLISKLSVPPPSATLDTTEGSKEDKEKVLKKEKVGDSQKVGTSKGEEGLKILSKAEARPEAITGAPQWKCPRCSFVNLDSKHRCVECSRRRPQRTYVSDTPKSTDGDSLVDEDLDVKIPVDERQAKKAHGKKESLPSLSTQVRENLKVRSPSLATEVEGSMDDEESSSEADVASEGSDPFDVLDAILESEDSDDEQQEEGKAALLSEDSEEEQQGSGKRAPLSDLFVKKTNPPPRRDDNRGSEQRNDFGKKAGKRPLKDKKFEGDDDNRRSRYGSVGDDEQEDSLEDDDPPPRRGFGSRDNEDHSRKFGRGGGGYNSFRGRGGSRGGFGGSRGNSYDDRRSDGGPRGSRGYGDNDRGGRSSSYGSRAPRGRSRY